MIKTLLLSASLHQTDMDAEPVNKTLPLNADSAALLGSLHSLKNIMALLPVK